MTIKFPVSVVAIATALTLAYSAVASAEIYKTSKDQVVVTDLTAKQKYEIQTVNAKGKTKKRKAVAANTCGEVIVSNAGKMKSVMVGTQSIDPATLITKVHPRCKAKKSTKIRTAPKIAPSTSGM